MEVTHTHTPVFSFPWEAQVPLKCILTLVRWFPGLNPVALPRISLSAGMNTRNVTPDVISDV